ncbi:MAG: hypothetical protein E7457_04550 [Ruminococcaceae bacterium]|nr:hypothetical protein [Oscillospiraceae bacterium]
MVPIAAFAKPNDPNSMVARCVRINGEYRRQAAHSGNISFDDAVDCCFEIYGEASAHMEAKRHSAEVISILRELFSILA